MQSYSVKEEDLPGTEVLIQVPDTVLGTVIKGSEVYLPANRLQMSVLVPRYTASDSKVEFKFQGRTFIVALPVGFDGNVSNEVIANIDIPAESESPTDSGSSRSFSENLEVNTNVPRATGFSHLQCKLLGPLLTRFKMDPDEGLRPITIDDRSPSMIQMREEFNDLSRNVQISRMFFSISRYHYPSTFNRASSSSSSSTMEARE